MCAAPRRVCAAPRRVIARARPPHMLMQVSESAAVVWVMTVGHGWNISVHVAAHGEQWTRITPVEMTQRRAEMATQSGRCVVSDLRPATSYRFKVLFTPDSPPASLLGAIVERDGEFRTSVSKGQRGEVAFSFGSCLFPSVLPMLPLGSLLLQPMSFFLLLGDAVYVDVPFNFATSVEMLYRWLVADPMWTALTSRTPVMAMFDDHEVQNNWDGSRHDPHARSAIEIWTQFLGLRNPPPPPEAPRDAKYFMAQHGDVRLFVADTRSHRVLESSAQSRSLLGAQQLECLRQFFFVEEATCGADLESGARAGTRSRRWQIEFPFGNTGKVRLRVLVTPVPFSDNAGHKIPARLSRAAPDGWRDFPKERQQVSCLCPCYGLALMSECMRAS